MDFCDQIALSARLAGEQPEVGELERTRSGSSCSTSTRTPRSPRRGCSSRLFSGPDGPPARHAVTAVGDPYQAIYGWRGASVANILGFAETSRRRRRGARRYR